MNPDSPAFLIPLITGAIFAQARVILLRFPPKKINGLYGYRSPASMKNQKRWDFSQKYAARQMMLWGIVLCALSIPAGYVQLTQIPAMIFGLVLMLICALLPIFKTERRLKQKFGRKV